MSLSLAEQETILRFDRESDVMVYETFSAAHARKLIKAGAKVHREWSRGGQRAWTLHMPKRWFRLPKPKSEARARATRLRQKARIEQRNLEATGPR